MPRINTFYSHVPMLSFADETKLILLWMERWEAAGFEPIVLTEYHAHKHPCYAPFCEKIDSLPSVNPPAYDRACYLRWLAMNAIGGGLMADYDCIPYEKIKLPKTGTRLLSYQNHVPSLVYGSAAGYQDVISAIMSYEVTEKDRVQKEKIHVSDMYILLNSGVPYEKRDTIKNYNEPGWETAPVVHYSTSSMSPTKLPRWKYIPTMR